MCVLNARSVVHKKTKLNAMVEDIDPHRKDEDYTNYKEALNAAMTEIRQSKKAMSKN